MNHRRILLRTPLENRMGLVPMYMAVRKEEKPKKGGVKRMYNNWNIGMVNPLMGSLRQYRMANKYPIRYPRC